MKSSFDGQDYLTINKEKRNLHEIFLSYFENKGYQFNEPVPLVTNDQSVLFTNATIIPWKKYLLGEQMLNKGLCMGQPCLRLHVLNDSINKDISNETSFNRFLGYFSMLGLLTPSMNNDNIANDLVDLFVNYYHIPIENIKVLASAKDSFVKSLEVRVNVNYDTEKDAFYHWTYGMEEVSGKGATFCLKQRNGEFKEIGQLIEITTPHGETFFEAGFGIETFLSRLQSRKDYSAWTIFHCVPEQYRFKTFLDLTSCFGTALSVDSDLVTRKHKKEIVRLARRIVHTGNLLNISIEDLEDSIDKFINVEFDLDLKDFVSQTLNHARNFFKDG